MTPSPTWTSTASPTSTPSPTWTSTPAISPEPDLQLDGPLEAAQRHQFNGDYERAISAYLALLDADPDSDQVRQAGYHLAEAYLLNRDYASSATAFEAFVAAYPNDHRLPLASLMLARAYHAMEDCAQAIPHYRVYLEGDGILADLVQGWLGDCHGAEGDAEAAIEAYKGGVLAAGPASLKFALREKTAAQYLLQGDFQAALTEYDAMLPLARFDYEKAYVEYLAGKALASAGDTEAALARYRRAVDDYPKADSAYLSLIELVDAGAEVGDLQRGLVDYWAGENHPEAYPAAIRAFDRYLAAEPSEPAHALYRKAQAHLAMDEAGPALQALQRLIDGFPDSSWQAPARLEKGEAQAWLGRYDEAVRTYQDLAAQFPGHELAPQALWQAATLRERQGSLASAAAAYKDLQASYPAYKDAAEALWRAGLAHYRTGDQKQAVATWQHLVESYPESGYRDKGLYWLGKLEVAPPRAEAGDYWDQLLESAPNSYYALRVDQIRTGEPLAATPFIPDGLPPATRDEVEAEGQVLAWLREWTPVPASASLRVDPAAHPSSQDLERGAALLEIGLRHEALDTFDRARASVWDDPLALAQLAFLLRDQGFHGLAARSALRLASLWPGGTIYTAPAELQRLAYPLAYTDLLLAEAQQRNLDPLILASLIRQESLFEPSVSSYAGARGLGQVMPATGRGIARSLGLEGFTEDDLYRPNVSVQFGAYYLAVQLNQFDDQLLVALAAYNGGPGNARRWLEAGGDDLDFFVEIIAFDQSRVYLQKVYQGYKIYERLYRHGDEGG